MIKSQNMAEGGRESLNPHLALSNFFLKIQTETDAQWRKAGTLDSDGSITVTHPSSNTARTSVCKGIHRIGYRGKHNINTPLDWDHPNLQGKMRYIANVLHESFT